MELGCVSTLDWQGRTIWIVYAHGYGKRFIVPAEEILTAFLELLHVLLSAQIKIGHAIVWMRIRVCVSFILRSLLPFGFAPWFARILRETFTRLADAPGVDSVSLSALMNCWLRFWNWNRNSSERGNSSFKPGNNSPFLNNKGVEKRKSKHQSEQIGPRDNIRPKPNQQKQPGPQQH